MGLDKADFKGYFVPEVFSRPGDFRIPPKEQEEMLPRQLLMLQTAAAALQDAQLTDKDLLFAGVYIGSGLDLNATNFSFRWGLQKYARQWADELGLQLDEKQFSVWLAELREAAGPALTANRTMGALGSVVASRIAKEFRIGGPSFTLSSEENSGLRALEVGIHALQEGAINRALVGAVDLAGDLRSVLGRHSKNPFSVSGTGCPFDLDSDGSLIGEGAAAVVLKRLEDARQDGDQIYAVINGIGTAIGGQIDSRVPEKKIYSKSIERACKNSNVAPETISYLEADGCAIPAVDRLEAQMLGVVIGQKAQNNSCKIGSVKADIGHAGAASGMASLVKTALCLQHKILPPIRNLHTLTPEWVRDKRKFVAPAAPQYWLNNRADGPRRVVVSGIGSDGSCSHAVLEEYIGAVKLEKSESTLRPLGVLPEGLFVVEAATPEMLLAEIDKLRQFSSRYADHSIDILARLWFGQNRLEPAHQFCLSLVACSFEELVVQLDHAQVSISVNPLQSIGVSGALPLAPALRDRLFYSPYPLGAEGKVAFVFPGSGNHFAGMGRELSARWPDIYRQQEQGSKSLADQYLPDHFWKAELSESIESNHNALVIS
ncbi:MAG: type I polyketide synthase, partial [Desulfuromusa sp.]|nr:type I polyketide synthase [Desulfuromusa sp.]